METLELIAVGDVSLSGPDGQDPFEHVARLLRAGDIVFGNLECVLCDTGAGAEKEITLRAAPARVGYLRQAGFDIVSVANNHILDFGPAGLDQTLAVLREQGIRFVGAGRTASQRGYEIIERKGLKVGFLAYYENGGGNSQNASLVNRIDRHAILEQIADLKRRCDVLVVSLHWGIEYIHYPSLGQIQLARDLLRSGAALVLGHHPHVVQGIERIGKGLIAYSLGSFQFEPRKEEARHSFILQVRISAWGVEDYRAVPAHIGKGERPRRVRNAHRREMLRFIERIGEPIRDGRITDKWWFEQAGATYLHDNLQAWAARVRKYGIRHLVQFARWLVSRFTIKCYLGCLRALVSPHE